MRLITMINILLLLLPLGLWAQQAHWEGGVTVGAQGYQGELSQGLLPELDERGERYGLMLRRHMSPVWSLRLNASYSSLSGSDLSIYEERDFSFDAQYIQGGAVLECDPFGHRRYPKPKVFRKLITPYFYAGIGWVQYEATANFKREDQNSMQELVEADQANTYPEGGLMLPFGLGVKADLSRSTVVGIEFITMTAFSDYLDGISQAGNPGANDWLPGASVVLSYRFLPKDSDRDGIADEEDACPQIKGVWSALGCPDRDFDGVEDLEDICPDQAGTLQLNGCPDTDGDGVADLEDRCPYQAGTLTTEGCPDRDQDQIADQDDSCPSLPGPSWQSGCPALDTDGDGLLSDEESVCTTQTGVINKDLSTRLETLFKCLSSILATPLEESELIGKKQPAGSKAFRRHF